MSFTSLKFKSATFPNKESLSCRTRLTKPYLSTSLHCGWIYAPIMHKVVHYKYGITFSVNLISYFVQYEHPIAPVKISAVDLNIAGRSAIFWQSDVELLKEITEYHCKVRNQKRFNGWWNALSHGWLYFVGCHETMKSPMSPRDWFLPRSNCCLIMSNIKFYLNSNTLLIEVLIKGRFDFTIFKPAFLLVDSVYTASVNVDLEQPLLLNDRNTLFRYILTAIVNNIYNHGINDII